MTTDGPIPPRRDREGQDLLGRLEGLTPASPEPDYEQMAAYAFAGRYAEGKRVADVRWNEVGRGSRLLAGTAAHVVGLTRSAEAAELASYAHPAPNVGYEEAELPTLPHPEDSFDVVVALGVVENLAEPEGLLAEIRRVLRPEGVLVVSVPDKAHDPRSRGGMYAPEAEELLGRYFGAVRLYGHGAVAGGFVGPYSGETANASVQRFRSSALNPAPGAGHPEIRSILAVCGESEVPEGEPFLLLDQDRLVFEEHEELARDVGLMWEEVDRMQETEAQSFQDTLKLFKSEVSYLRARVRSAEGRNLQLQNQMARLQERIQSMETSTPRRMLELAYRQLRGRIGSSPSQSDSAKETDDNSRA